MRRIRQLCTLWLLACLCWQAWGMTIRITAPEGPNDPRHLYYVQLLQLALDHTSQKGSYQLTTYPREVAQSRAFSLINAGEIDLTDKDREAQFLPIRIPLMQGLMGYRVILINKQDEALFARMSVDELKQLPCYQGADWPDTTILRANGFNVRGVSDYKRIHTMLDKGAIHCFPRGILEAWGEITMKQLQNTMVDRHFLLIYPTDMYFFVHQDNHALAALIEKGLRAAIKDGSFARLLKNYPPHKEALEQVDFPHREIVHLQNPLLPAATPLGDKSLWFSPSAATPAQP